MQRGKWRARSVSCAVSSPHPHSTRACESSSGCRPDVDTNSRNTLYRLHSVHREDYVWHPEQPASGDVRFHGIYSFKQVIRTRDQYGYPASDGPFLFGSVKIWGEIVEHEDGYRSQFARIASLDYGHPELLGKFRAIYHAGGCTPV